jgi:hypothetical protein
MVGGLHMPIWNKTKKSLAIALSGVGRWLRGQIDDGDNVTNVNDKPSELSLWIPSLYNEYIIINLKKKRTWV